MTMYDWWCPKCGRLCNSLFDGRVCPQCKTDTEDMIVEIVVDTDSEVEE